MTYNIHSMAKQDRSEMREIAKRIVDQEIRLNVSELVGELSEQGQYSDQLAEVMTCADYESAARDADFRIIQSAQVAPGKWFWRPDDGCNWTPTDYHDTPAEAWQDCCEVNEIEPHYEDCCQWWAVTDRMADKLEAQGEAVTRDFLGLNIWGRTGAGMALEDEDVILSIAIDSWSQAHG